MGFVVLGLLLFVHFKNLKDFIRRRTASITDGGK